MKAHVSPHFRRPRRIFGLDELGQDPIDEQGKR